MPNKNIWKQYSKKVMNLYTHIKETLNGTYS